eukprot:148784-Pyramimonas_sp.AAC.1
MSAQTLPAIERYSVVHWCQRPIILAPNSLWNLFAGSAGPSPTGGWGATLSTVGTVDAPVGHGVAKIAPIVLEVPGNSLIWAVDGLSAGIGRPRTALSGACPSGSAPALIGFPTGPP